MTYRQFLSKCRFIKKNGWEPWTTAGGEIRLGPSGDGLITSPLQAVCWHVTGVAGNDSIEGAILILDMGSMVANRIAAASEYRVKELRTPAMRRVRRDLLRSFGLRVE